MSLTGLAPADWDAGPTTSGPACDIITRFEQQVALHPDRPAVAWPGGWLTFAQLNAAANRLARRLVVTGIRAESRVAICAGREAVVVVAILAVWKAGGAYVPLDPAHPEEWLRLLLDDCRPHLVLTCSESLDRLGAPAKVVVLDEVLARPSLDPDGNLELPVAAGQLAYIIYTSGSTGRPKGVEVERGNLAHLLLANHHVLHPAAGPQPLRVALTASFGFDASVNQLSWLMRGDTVWLVDEETRRDTHALTAYLSEHRIDVIDVTPSQLAVLVSLGLFEDAHRVPSVVIVAGEPTGPALWNRLREIPATRFFNLYGPTEATVYATAQPLEEADATPAIGRPVTNTRAYVVDEHGAAVPVGATGELWIGGSGVARGYLGRPDLTAERFLDDPFTPGVRVYRTGDLVRRLPKGRLEFIGRGDDQVKIRGVRVEPGEVAAELARHPGVGEAAVVACTDSTTGRRLVAYVTAARQPNAPHEEVSGWQAVFQDAHAGDDLTDPGFDIRGWNSSYTGQSLTADEMRDWAERTVARIAELGARRVLEIGVGSGLLMWRLAPHCERYVGTDFSATTVDLLRKRLDSCPTGGVSVHHAEAIDLAEFAGETFDCVVINSVVQYFPDQDYLRTVLRTALEALEPDGHLFVGDVRHLGLQDAFHVSVVRQRYPLEPPEQQHRLVLERRAEESELLLAPEWFEQFAAEHGLSAPCIAPKTGPYDNELNRFRYDVVLSPATGGQETVAGDWIDVATRPLDLAELQRLAEREDRVLLRRVPHAQLAPLVRSAEELLGSQAKSGRMQSVLTPAVVERVAAAAGKPVSVSWRAGHRDGAFDAVIGAGTWQVVFPPSANLPAGVTASTPRPRTQSLAARYLPAELEAYAAAKLPEHMRPSAILVLPHLPLTSNGKLDRAALPEPPAWSGNGPALGVPADPLQTTTEKVIAALWGEVLALSEVRRHDNFFQLGGDSLTAASMLGAISGILGVRVSLRQAMSAVDLADFCVLVDLEMLDGLDNTEIERLLNEIEDTDR